MTAQEIQRVVQYVTASTSYERDTVDQIIRTGFRELANLVLSFWDVEPSPARSGIRLAHVAIVERLASRRPLHASDC